MDKLLIKSKKSILFIMPFFSCGGTETALLSLLSVIPKDEYDISLLLVQQAGDYLSRIPDYVHLIKMDIPEKEQGVFLGKKNQLKNYLRQGKIVKAFSSFLYNRKTEISEDRNHNAAYFERIADSIPQLPGRYDLAIDYFGYATFTTFFLAKKVDAAVKASWLHTTMSNLSPEPFLPYYEKMDHIFAVSEMVKNDFESVFPTLNNVSVFANIINQNEIRQKALEEKGFDDDYDGLRILTVGRISIEKGQRMAAQALKKLIDDGYHVRWYFVGKGTDEEIDTISLCLSSEEKEEYIRFLGMKSNPYPYMAECDIYVQPSHVEGYCTTTNEARILGCPIVMTNVSGAKEQIDSGHNGLIVDINAEAIYEGIKTLIDHPKLVSAFRENLKEIDCDTTKKVKDLLSLIS